MQPGHIARADGQIAWDYQVSRESRKNRLEELRAAISDASRGSGRPTPEPQREPRGAFTPHAAGVLEDERMAPEKQQEPQGAATAPVDRGTVAPHQSWGTGDSDAELGAAKNRGAPPQIAALREVVQLQSALQASERSRKETKMELVQARRQAALLEAGAISHADEVAAVTEQLRQVKQNLDESQLELATVKQELNEERQRNLLRAMGSSLPDPSGSRASSKSSDDAPSHHLASDSRARRLLEEASILRHMARLTSPLREGVAKGRGAVAAAIAAGVLTPPRGWDQHAAPDNPEDAPGTSSGTIPSCARNLLDSNDDATSR